MDNERTGEVRPRIVLVDDEEALVWSLSNRMAKARPGYRVDTANDGHTALNLVKAEPTDLLITDISMEGMAGTELILLARRVIPDLPVIVITAYPTSELKHQAVQGSIEYLDKPFEFDAFIRCVDEVLDRRKIGFSGAISAQTLPDIVQLYALSNATGLLRIRRRMVEGAIWFDHGAIVHAATSNGTGANAFNEIMLWSGGEFSMLIGAVAPERSIRIGWAELLMESCRLIDEQRREVDLAATGPLSRRGWSLSEYPAASSETDAEERASDDIFNFSDNAAEPVTGGTEHLIVDVFLGDARVSTEENAMDYKRAIGKLSSIDGFVGGAIVDSDSGMILGHDGGGPVNLEIAAAGNTEVVRAKRKTMRNLALNDTIEDILISLSKQYHIIRPVRAKPELFFYLVIDRQKANLAMARLSLADIEKELSA